ncbi:MAG: bacteriohemerythrin [Comamonas sp.]|nr:bacteriohemerythrin [Comamonas sp.]
MSFIPWSSALMLGIPKIDAQHQVLVELINALHDELGKPAPARTTLAEVLEGLVDYTHNHFIEEEVMFQRYGYPQTTAHTAEHSQFTAKAMDWLMRFEDGEDINLEALDFLKDWLLHHILQEDRAYVPFLQEAIAAHAPSLSPS